MKPSIFSYFTQYKLTNSQVEALKNLEDFLNNSDKDAFILRGYAGTGKTFLMKGVTSYLNNIDREFLLAAPTGKAAKVLTKNTDRLATTIHKLIYGNPTLEPYVDDEVNSEFKQTATFRLHAGLVPNIHNSNAVYIVDEASMISDRYSEGEFILSGSGYLLKDLIKFINFDINEHNKKLILIGDPAQLPPVKQTSSPALDAKYLEQNYGLRTLSIELTEVVRQKKDSGILSNATDLRKAIAKKKFNNLSMQANKVDVEEITGEHLLSLYIKCVKEHGISKAAIIAATNNKTNNNNRLIHNYLYPDHPNIQPGDILMVYKNHQLYANGTLVVINEIKGDPIHRVITLKSRNKITHKPESVKVPLTFRTVTIQEIGSDVISEETLLESFVYDRSGELSSDQQKALFVDFLIRNRDIKYSDIYKNPKIRDQIRVRMMSDPYLFCLIAKWGYAFTCHKAQGSEWDHVFLDCESFNKAIHNESYFRWLYTAVTRAKEKLYFFNAPKFTNSTGLSFIGTPEQVIPFKKRSHGNCEFQLDHSMEPHPSHHSPVIEQSRETFKPLEVKEIANDFVALLKQAADELLIPLGAKIIEIKHNSYSESYFIDCGGNACVRIDIYYNAKNRVTNVRPGGTDALSVMIAKIMRKLTNFQPVMDSKPETLCHLLNDDEPQTSVFSEAFKQEFFDRLQSTAASRGISVTLVREMQWSLRLNFSGLGGQAVMDFFYNGREEFTKIAKVSTKRMTPELNSAVNDIVDELSK